MSNYGTALQAYALQRYLQLNYGDDVELIDYIYPNSTHKQKRSLYKRLKGVARITLEYVVCHRAVKNRLFKDFRNRYFKLSNKQLHNYQQLAKECPQYDLYITGSDQVWNVYTVKNDPAFYLTFLPDSAFRISFGSSFAVKEIPQEYKEYIRKWLSLYSFIGVRECSSLHVLKSLSLPENIQCVNTCDPTFLLSVEEYDKILVTSRIKLESPYILVYMLDYAFNPHPGIDVVVTELQRKLSCDVIIIGRKRIVRGKCIKHLYKVGPAEFLWLFKHAKFVVTSSFHGTMFSLIFQRPFVAITPTEKELDVRIQDLIQIVGIKNCIVQSNITEYSYSPNDIFTHEVCLKINEYVSESKRFLQNAINVCLVNKTK